MVNKFRICKEEEQLKSMWSSLLRDKLNDRPSVKDNNCAVYIDMSASLQSINGLMDIINTTANTTSVGEINEKRYIECVFEI